MKFINYNKLYNALVLVFGVTCVFLLTLSLYYILMFNARSAIIAVFLAFVAMLFLFATIEAAFRSGQIKVNKNTNSIVDEKDK